MSKRPDQLLTPKSPYLWKREFSAAALRIFLCTHILCYGDFLAKNEPLSSVSQKKQVLVIDDDESVLNTTVKILEKNGFYADKAETGKEAIEKSKAHHYDVALIDLKLPDMDGIEVLSKANFQNTVKIMLTGYPSFVTGIQAMDQDVDAYLHKPVRPEELVMLVKSKLAASKRMST